MFTYQNILNDKDIMQKYEQIEIETNYVIAHGIVHVNNVLDLCKNIATALKLTEDNARLLYIACALHDIGRFIDNKTHNLTSEKFAREYLQEKLTPNELDIVCNAIRYHSQECAEFDKMDDIAYCLILADKLDYQKNRLLKHLMHQATTPHFNKLKYCDKMCVKVENNSLIIQVYQNNKEMENIVKDMDKVFLHIILDEFVKHFKLNSYTYEFI